MRLPLSSAINPLPKRPSDVRTRCPGLSLDDPGTLGLHCLLRSMARLSPASGPEVIWRLPSHCVFCPMLLLPFIVMDAKPGSDAVIVKLPPLETDPVTPPPPLESCQVPEIFP